jgi:hypothetical protein
MAKAMSTFVYHFLKSALVEYYEAEGMFCEVTESQDGDLLQRAILRHDEIRGKTVKLLAERGHHELLTPDWGAIRALMGEDYIEITPGEKPGDIIISVPDADTRIVSP